MNKHTEQTPLDDLKEDSAQRGKNSKTRRLLIFLLCLWLITFIGLLGVAWNAYFGEKERAQTLAQQIAAACRNGSLGPGISREDEKALCENAHKVIVDDPELQDGEIQEDEIQNPEVDDPEIQNPEIGDDEKQDPEAQDKEIQDSEDQNDETQDAENQDPEIDDPDPNDPENQDPEIDDPDPDDPDPDDPDPNDQINGGDCTFSGSGTITFTLQTTSGPVSFQCTGTGSPPNPGGGKP